MTRRTKRDAIINVRIDAPTKERLEALCEADDRTLSAYCARVLMDHAAARSEHPRAGPRRAIASKGMRDPASLTLDEIRSLGASATTQRPGEWLAPPSKPKRPHKPPHKAKRTAKR